MIHILIQIVIFSTIIEFFELQTEYKKMFAVARKKNTYWSYHGIGKLLLIIKIEHSFVDLKKAYRRFSRWHWSCFDGGSGIIIKVKSVRTCYAHFFEVMSDSSSHTNYSHWPMCGDVTPSCYPAIAIRIVYYQTTKLNRIRVNAWQTLELGFHLSEYVCSNSYAFFTIKCTWSCDISFKIAIFFTSNEILRNVWTCSVTPRNDYDSMDNQSESTRSEKQKYVLYLQLISVI